MPEITEENMYGFLNNDYKIRRLNSSTDLAFIFGEARKLINAEETNYANLQNEINKASETYSSVIGSREKLIENETYNNDSFSLITTDDERIILYYLISNSVRKAQKSDIQKWINESEIYDVNIDNAFDLLSSIGTGRLTEDNVLEFSIDVFRTLQKDKENMLETFKKTINQHINLASDKLLELHRNKLIPDTQYLFIKYIIDNNIHTLGTRWMAEGEMKNISYWEERNRLDSSVSSNYDECVAFFNENNFIYESDWTSYGNARQYTIVPSLLNLLDNCPKELEEKIDNTINEHLHFEELEAIEDEDLPF